MKKYFNKIIPILSVLIGLGVILFPQLTEAATFIEGVGISAVNSFIAMLANWLLGLMSVFVIAGGIFLSMSINLTIHIGDFFKSKDFKSE